ncbi:hypothetical protein FRC11_005136 [Ceratobasidium sp. 423]|nr:hypothetical protein FRC11_005136 [Ceratobasidium sp. 423]
MAPITRPIAQGPMGQHGPAAPILPVDAANPPAPVEGPLIPVENPPLANMPGHMPGAFPEEVAAENAAAFEFVPPAFAPVPDVLTLFLSLFGIVSDN